MSSSTMSGPSAWDGGWPSLPAFSARSSRRNSPAIWSTFNGGNTCISGNTPSPGSMTLATRSLMDFAITAPDGDRRRAISASWCWPLDELVIEAGAAVLPVRMPYLGSARGQHADGSTRGNQVYACQDDRLSIRALQSHTGAEPCRALARGKPDQSSARWQLSELGSGTRDSNPKPGP